MPIATSGLMSSFAEQKHGYLAPLSEARCGDAMDQDFPGDDKVWRPPFRDVPSTQIGGEFKHDRGTSPLKGSRSEFQLGEKVRYWSDTHDQWMDSVVQKVHRDENDHVIHYDLDVKRGAMPKKIRSSAAHEEAEAEMRLAELEQEKQRNYLLEEAEALYEVDENVEYWSATYKTWMPAIVEKIHNDQGNLAYTLDVKKGAQPTNMRKPKKEEKTLKVDALSPYRPQTSRTAYKGLEGENGAIECEKRLETKFTLSAYKGPRAENGAIEYENRVETKFTLSGTPPSSRDHTPLSRLSSVPSGTPLATPTSAALKEYSFPSTSIHSHTQAAPITTVLQRCPSDKATSLRNEVAAKKRTISYNVALPGKSSTGAQQTISFEYPQVVQKTAQSTSGSRPVSTISTRSEGVKQPPLTVEDLQIGAGKFEPRQPHILSQLVAKLGLSRNTGIEALKGFIGGRNEGVWILTDKQGARTEQYVLKLVSCHRPHQAVPTEMEQFVKLSKDHPGLRTDTSMAFPVKLFACQNPGPRRYDLIVMRSAAGARLSEVLSNKWYAQRIQEVFQILRCVGACLKRYHLRYGNTQHSDLQPSNVFWDEATHTVTFIDLGGMGLPTVETDNEHFKKALRMMTEKWGAIREDCCRMFDAGYREER